MYDSIYGIQTSEEHEDEDDADKPYDKFIDSLQECVAEDDAIIILEAGNEKMSYVVGAATVITSTECKYMDITSIATEKAAELLHNPQWHTRCDY